MIPDLVERLKGARTVHRGYRFRLYPTPAQEAVLEQYCGVVRAVYNAAWEQRDCFWRQHLSATGRHICFATQAAEVKALRYEFDWIAAVPHDAIAAALRDLDRAFVAYFGGVARYPSPRKKGANDAFRLRDRDCPARKLNARWASVYVPKLGHIKYRSTRPLDGEGRSITVSRRGGAWWVAFLREVPAPSSVPLAPTVGIDRGVAQTLTLSTGEVFQCPDLTSAWAERRLLQRGLSRKQRGSQRHAAQAGRVAKIGARMARIRTDWCHRASTDLARRFGAVALEDLNVAGMTASARATIANPGRNVRQKAGLNRAILDQSWSRFAGFLEYKLAARGGHLITVPAAYTSQTCSECGVIDARSRKSQAVFECVACGHTANADQNAACEILRRSTASMGVEGEVARPTKRQPGSRRATKPISVGGAET